MELDLSSDQMELLVLAAKENGMAVAEWLIHRIQNDTPERARERRALHSLLEAAPPSVGARLDAELLREAHARHEEIRRVKAERRAKRKPPEI